MNNFMRRLVMDRRMRDRAYRDGTYDGNYDRGRSEFEGEFRGNYDGDYDGRSYGRRRDYDGEDYEMADGRRGVKYTGRYGIGGSRYYGRRRDRALYEEDYAEGDEMKLTKSEMREWKEDLQNADGSHGPHFSSEQIMQAMQALGLQPRGYTEKELCLAANMLYSDYCKVFEQFIPRDKEAMVYVKMAKAFLDDPDASVKGGEKLAAYYYAIVDDDE